MDPPNSLTFHHDEQNRSRFFPRGASQRRTRSGGRDGRCLEVREGFLFLCSPADDPARPGRWLRKTSRSTFSDSRRTRPFNTFVPRPLLTLNPPRSSSLAPRRLGTSTSSRRLRKMLNSLPCRPVARRTRSRRNCGETPHPFQQTAFPADSLRNPTIALRGSLPLLAAYITDSQLERLCRIHGWIYDVETGLVEDLVRLFFPPSFSQLVLE